METETFELPSTIVEVGGQKLDLAIRYGDKVRVLKFCEVDLANVTDGAVFTQLSEDGDLAILVAWTLVADQWMSYTVEGHQPGRDINPAGEDDETVNAARTAFGDSLGPEEIDALRDALTAAIVGFCPKELRPAIMRLVNAMRGKTAEAINRYLDRVESGEIDGQIDRQIDLAISRATAVQPEPLAKAPRRGARSTSTSSATS